MKKIAANNGSILPGLALAIVVWSSLALFFLLVSWAAGGDKFKDSIYGNYGLTVMILGLIVGFVLHFVSCRRKTQAL